MKTLGQIAYEAIGPSAPEWDLMYEEDQQRWEKVGGEVNGYGKVQSTSLLQ